MPTLRTARVRRALSDPNRAPPGTTAPTFGAGLTVTGDAVVAVDFGAGAAQVPTGTKVPGTIPVDTRGATDGDALRYDAGEGAFVPSADALPWSSVIAPTTVRTVDATQATLETIAPTTGKITSLDLIVSAGKSDRSAAVTWRVLASLTHEGGVVAVRNYTVTDDGGAGAAGWSVDLDVSGTDVRVRVTGSVGTTVDWCCAGTLLAHGG